MEIRIVVFDTSEDVRYFEFIDAELFREFTTTARHAGTRQRSTLPPGNSQQIPQEASTQADP